MSRHAISRTTTVVVVIVIAIIAIASYAVLNLRKPSPTSTTQINIGVFAPMSGTYALEGQQILAAVQIGADQVNAHGGLDIAGRNYTINVIAVDISSDPSQAPSLADAALSKYNFTAAIDTSLSPLQLAIEPVMEKHHVPNLSGGIALAISSGQYQYFFGPGPNATAQGLVTVQFLQYLNKISPIKSIGIAYENTAFGVSAANSTKQLLTSIGFAPKFYQSYPTPLTAADASSLVTSIQQSGVQLLYLASNSISDGELILKTIQSMGVKVDVFGSGPAYDSQSLYQAVGNATNGVLDIDGWLPDVNPAFTQAFEHKTGQVPISHAGFAYACFWVVVDGILKADSANPVSLQKALLTLKITSGPAYQTLGPISFSPITHRNPNNPLFVGQWINGTFHTVFPLQFATAKVIWPPS